MRKLSRFLVFLMLGACSAPLSVNSSGAAGELLELFPLRESLPDTFFVGVEDRSLPNPEELPQSRLIPNHLMTSVLDSLQMVKLMPVDLQMDTFFIAHFRLPLDEYNVAALVEVRQHWFSFKSLLIFDQETNSWTGVQPVAEFYGGDGGQVLTESYLFDRSGDGRPDIISHRSGSFLDTDGETVVDRTGDEILYYRWKQGRYFPQAVRADEERDLIRQFPVYW